MAVRPDFFNLRKKWIGKEKLSPLLNGKNCKDLVYYRVMPHISGVVGFHEMVF